MPLDSASLHLQVMFVHAYQTTLASTVNRNCGHVQRTRAKDVESVLRREKHFIAVAMHGGKVS